MRIYCASLLILGVAGQDWKPGNHTRKVGPAAGATGTGFAGQDWKPGNHTRKVAAAGAKGTGAKAVSTTAQPGTAAARAHRLEARGGAESAVRGAARSGAAGNVAARRPNKGGASTADPGDGSTAQVLVHGLVALLECAAVLYVALSPPPSEVAALKRAGMSTLAVLALEALAHLVVPLAYMSVGVVISISVIFTINPVSGTGALPGLHMGSVPLLCVGWLHLLGLMSRADLVLALYGTPSLRPYHLVVMFLGSVYLCTALERSGFLRACEPQHQTEPRNAS